MQFILFICKFCVSSQVWIVVIFDVVCGLFVDEGIGGLIIYSVVECVEMLLLLVYYFFFSVLVLFQGLIGEVYVVFCVCFEQLVDYVGLCCWCDLLWIVEECMLVVYVCDVVVC